MPQANVHFIRSSQLSKMGPIGVADAINQRITYAKAAFSFAIAKSALEGEGYKLTLEEGEFSLFDACHIGMRTMGEIHELTENLYELARGSIA